MIKKEHLKILKYGLSSHGKTNNNKLRESLNIKKGNASFRNFMNEKNDDSLEYPGQAVMKNIADTIDYEFVGIMIPKDSSKIKEDLENLINTFYLEASKKLANIASNNLYSKKEEIVRVKRIPIEQKISSNFIKNAIISDDEYDVSEFMDDEPLQTMKASDITYHSQEISPELNTDDIIVF